jgi:DNA polymerase sigma
MVLKQWLFQRQMNEVYIRGGLSSYALFLLVLTVVNKYRFESICPPDEAVGRYLLQFLRQWGTPTALAEVIRPLRGPMEKLAAGWEDSYQPLSLCILLG